MINNLIEKYKEKIEYYSKLDSVNCNIRTDLYTQILQDLEELKQNINKLTENKYDLCIDVINGEIIGGTDE